MQVSVSGYYARRKRPASQRQQQNTRLREQITTAHQESKATYGSPRIYKELHEQGNTSEKRIARLMRLCGLRGTLPKRFVVTTNSDQALPVAENLLAREFTVLTPNARWTTDITYIWTQQGWLYLAVILNLFSRRIVGVLPCMSFSRNAGVDARRTVKYEEVYLNDYETPRETRQALTCYLAFYNEARPHQSLGYKTPAQVYFDSEQTVHDKGDEPNMKIGVSVS